MSVIEILSYLSFIIIGYCIGKLLLSSYESYGPSPSPTILSSGAGAEVDCTCFKNSDGILYQQKAHFYGGEHVDPVEDYCDQFSNDKSGCEDMFYKNFLGDYKICKFDGKNCSSKDVESCDYFDYADRQTWPQCTNREQKECCITNHY